MLKKICAAAMSVSIIFGAGSGLLPEARKASAAGLQMALVEALPVSVLKETFDFADSYEGKKVASWNGWNKSEGSSGTLDSDFTLGKDSDGNKVAFLKRTAASTTSSRDYRVVKNVDIGYGTEKIGIGLRIKSMDTDNGNFLLLLETERGTITINVDLRNSRILTPQITTPFVTLGGKDGYEVASLDRWFTVEIIIDTNLKQIDFYTEGVYRASSDISTLATSYGGDVFNGKLKAVSIGTTRTTGVASGGDSALMYVDDVTVKTDGSPGVKITETEVSDGEIKSVTVKANSGAVKNGKLVAASYQYGENGIKIEDVRLLDLLSGKITLNSPLQIPENGEAQLFVFDGNKAAPITKVKSLTKSQMYYVSPDGDDAGGGTKLHPWKTLYKASREIGAGDTVIIADGEYYENYITQIKVSGSEDAPITIKAENRRGAEIIYPSTAGKKEKFSIYDGADYVTVEGLCFSQQSPQTDEKETGDIYLKCEGDYCNIIGNSFSGALEEGIKLNRSVGTIVADNYIENMVHEGIDVFNSDNVKVYGNEIHNVSRIGILAKGNTRNSQIYNNYVHNSTAKMSNCAYCIGGISDKTSPYDISEGTGYECYSSVFYNNIALAHGSGTIDSGFKWYGSIDCRMYNNIVIGAKTGIYFASYTAHWEWSPKNVNPVVKNNIIYKCEDAYEENSKSIQAGSKTTADYSYNLFYDCDYPLSASFNSNIIKKDPKFVSVPDNLHIQAGSPAAGKGTHPGSTIPRYILNEEKTTITKSPTETINIEFTDKDGKKRTSPYDMGIYELE